MFCTKYILTLYQALLADLLLAGEIDLSEVNSVSNDVLVNALWNLMDDALTATETSSVDISQVLKNTLTELDYSGFNSYLDNTAFTTILDLLWTAAGNCDYTDIDEDGVLDTLIYDGTALENFVKELGTDLAANCLDADEVEDGLSATLNIKIANAKENNTKYYKEYDALVLDPSATGLTQMIGFKTNLSTAVTTAGSGAIVVLTDDYEGSINTSNTLYLDLNGHTITGDVSGENITVIDSSLGDTGSITGESDYEKNTLYSVDPVEDESSGEITGYNVYLNPDDLLEGGFDAKEIAVTLAFDLLLNSYMNALMTVTDGENNTYDIYAVKLEDLVGMLAEGTTSLSELANELLDCVTLTDDNQSSTVGISGLLTSILTDFTDFETLYTNANDGNALASYSVDTAYWNLDVVLTEGDDGEYLTANVASVSNETKTTEISVYLENPTDEETGELISEKREEVVKLLKSLSEVATVSEQSIVISEAEISSGKTLSLTGSASMDVYLDLDDDDNYALVTAILLANATSEDVQSGLISAIEGYYDGDSDAMTAVKDAVNNASVNDLVSALKAVGYSTDLEDLITGLDLSIDSTDVAELYDSYKILFAAMKNVLNLANVTGSASLLSTYYNEEADTTESHQYTLLLQDRELRGSPTVSGITADYTLTVNSELTMDLFNLTEEEEEEYAIVVTSASGEPLYNGDNLVDAFKKANASSGSTVTIYGAVSMTDDIEVSENTKVTLTVESGGSLTQGSYKFTLLSGATLTSNKSNLKVSSSVSDKKVNTTMTTSGSNTVYSLGYYDVVVYSSSGSVLWAGDSLSTAFSKATSGSTVTVYGDVSMTGNIAVSKKVTLKVAGSGSLTQGSYKFTLSSGATLTSNKKMTVASSASDMKVNTTTSGSNTVYSLGYYDVVVYSSSGSVLYAGSSLSTAFSKATSGSTVTVYGDVSMTGNIAVSKKVTLKVAGSGSLTQGSYHFILSPSSASKISAVSLTSNVTLKNTATAMNYTTVKSSNGKYYLTAVSPSYSGTSATVTTGSSIKAEYVVTGSTESENYIYLDVDPNGITADQFKAAVSHSAVSGTYSSSTLTSVDVTEDKGLVYTGAKATFTASNSVSSNTATITYTVIIMGDTNCNGWTDSGDATLMMQHYQGIRSLTGVAYLAVDMNWNGSLDSGDATRNQVKYQTWNLGTYVSQIP
ncbi:MAG: dockerin type I repeat-containing protein [Clostridiales bacterium]|nr:dockerin type I repeat-containing protein [Clostridiales bacterium]